jgi:hypothetical protein
MTHRENFARGALVQRVKDGGKPRSRFWGFVLFAVPCIVFYGHLAIIENDTAKRQQTSFGTTSQCERLGRGRENWCHYWFAVGDNWYRGVSQTYPEVTFGQTVEVYYDNQDPRINSLEDFSAKSRKDERFVYIFLLALAATGTFILWNEEPRGVSADEQSP